MVKILVGEENYMKMLTLKELIEQYEDENVLISTSYGSNEKEFYNTTGFLGSKLLILKVAMKELQGELLEVVQSGLSDEADNDMVILLTDIDKRLKSYKTLSKHMNFYNRLHYSELAKYIQERIRITDEGLRLLIDRSGYLDSDSCVDLFYINNLINTLSIVCDTCCDENDVDEYVSDISSVAVWDILEPLSLGNMPQVFRIASEVATNGGEAISLLSAMLYHFRTAFKVGLFGNDIGAYLKNNRFLRVSRNVLFNVILILENCIESIKRGGTASELLSLALSEISEELR